MKVKVVAGIVTEIVVTCHANYYGNGKWSGKLVKIRTKKLVELVWKIVKKIVVDDMKWE